MLVLMKHSTEPVAASYIKAGDLARSQRHGQWLERTGVGDALMRPVPVVELLELPEGAHKVGLVPDQRAVSSSRGDVVGADIHPCWSGSMPVLVEDAAESVPSADVECALRAQGCGSPELVRWGRCSL